MLRFGCCLPTAGDFSGILWQYRVLRSNRNRHAYHKMQLRCIWIGNKHLLHLTRHRSFLCSNNKLEMTELPFILTRTVKSTHHLHKIEDQQNWGWCVFCLFLRFRQFAHHSLKSTTLWERSFVGIAVPYLTDTLKQNCSVEVQTIRHRCLFKRTSCLEPPFLGLLQPF